MNFWPVVLTGCSLGVALGVSVGPGILRLLDLALRGERERALAMVLGLLGPDVVYLALAAVFFASPAGEGVFAGYRVPLAWLSFAILVAFAVAMWRSPPLPPEAVPIRAGGRASAFFSGFAMNLFNPFIPVFWFGAVSLFAVQHADLVREDFWRPFAVFASACLVTVAASDVLKVYLFERVGAALRVRFSGMLDRLRRAGAVLLVGFGLRILFRVYAGESP